jgi:murein DD-endopeptidase MepM/ murein hydrolase activator NlpD
MTHLLVSGGCIAEIYSPRRRIARPKRDKPLAFVIISTGPMTSPSLRTIGAGRLALASGVMLALLMAACVGLGYGMASTGASSPSDPMTHSAAALDPDHPAGQVLANHVGALAGRLSRLEGEAAALGRRIGLEAVPTTEPPQEEAAKPAGGPFLPVAGLAATQAAFARPADSDDLNLGRIELQIEMLETGISRLADAVAEREIETLAYPYRLPVAGQGNRVTSSYGVRHDPLTGRLARHTGLDIPAPHGTPILASGGGRVVSAGYKGAYGRAVVIDHGDGLSTLYGHASKLLVRAGDVVMPNQQIALVGSTGRSTGPHLHFEVIRHGVRVEPRQYLSHVLGRGSER